MPEAPTDRERLQQAIAALEGQRATIGDAVVDTALIPLRQALAALRTRPLTPVEQRKQVTVLFADVSGFTALSETLDAEDVSGLINALWSQLDNVIATHGGVIDKHIGDAVMALFGLPTAQEDDAERAIRAALAMQVELAQFSRTNARPLRMRIGLNTGPVLLSVIGTTNEYTAIGDTVNVASRLEHAAPLGGVLISHDTYRHVRGLFAVHATGPLEVKGKAEPIEAYVVTQARPRAFRLTTRGVEGLETQMVGRDAELQQLQTAFNNARGQRFASLVTVLGEAGVGKSRLLYEFMRWLELQPTPTLFFKGRATPDLMTQPYGLLRHVVAEHFGIQENDSASVAREKLEQGLTAILGAAPTGVMRAHYIGQLLGFDFAASPHLVGALTNARQFHDRAAGYLTEFFKTLASTADKAGVILLEDIHWADDSSLAWIEALTAVPDLPVLIICLARPSLLERQPGWAAHAPRHLQVELSSLSEQASQALVENILRKVEALPASFRDVIVKAAEGNPFYIEELIKMLVEEGLILPGAERWRVEAGRLAQVRVPPTLTSLLQARLDRLPPAERETLQGASVVGRIFWEQALAHVSREVSGSAAVWREALPALQKRELIFAQPTSAFAGTDEYFFKHAMLRDVTYESVLKRVRRVCHARVAQWLIEQSGERVNEYAALIAEHYALAGQPAEAVTYLSRAGEQAYNIGAYREALSLWDRALAQVTGPDWPADSPTIPWKIKLLRQLGDAFYGVSELATAKDRLLESLALARQSDDQQAAANVLSRLGRLVLDMGDYDAALPFLEEGLALARATEDRAVLVHLLRNLGTAAYFMGKYDQATDDINQSLALARELNDPTSVAHALNNLGVVASELGDHLRAQQHYQDSLAIARAIGDRDRIAMTLDNLGIVAMDLGNYAQAQALYQESLTLTKEIGYQLGVAVCLDNLAMLALRQGEPQTAAQHLREALTIALNLKAMPMVLVTVVGLAEVRARMTQPETAAELASFALAQAMLASDMKTKAETILAEVKKSLSPELVAAAQTRGQARDLSSVVADLLRE